MKTIRCKFHYALSCLLLIVVGCASTAPLPQTLNIVPPAEDVPLEIAVFSGVWEGNFWNGLDTKLVVVEIDNEKAELIISIGQYQGGEPSYFYQSAKVVSGAMIEFTNPNGDVVIMKIIDKEQNKLKMTIKEKKTGADLWAVLKKQTLN
jgi:hypothetical protein